MTARIPVPTAGGARGGSCDCMRALSASCPASCLQLPKRSTPWVLLCAAARAACGRGAACTASSSLNCAGTPCAGLAAPGAAVSAMTSRLRRMRRTGATPRMRMRRRQRCSALQHNTCSWARASPCLWPPPGCAHCRPAARAGLPAARSGAAWSTLPASLPDMLALSSEQASCAGGARHRPGSAHRQPGRPCGAGCQAAAASSATHRGPGSAGARPGRRRTGCQAGGDAAGASTPGQGCSRPHAQSGSSGMACQAGCAGASGAGGSQARARRGTAAHAPPPRCSVRH